MCESGRTRVPKPDPDHPVVFTMAGDALRDLSMWTLEVPPNGKPVTYEIEQAPDQAHYVHLTNVAIPYNGAAGPHGLTLEANGAQLTLATLDKASHPQHPLDLVLDQTVVLRNYGKGPVHLAGYITVAASGVDEDSSDHEDPRMMARARRAYGLASDSDDEDEDADFEEGEETEDGDAEGEQEDSDEPPLGVPLLQKVRGQLRAQPHKPATRST